MLNDLNPKDFRNIYIICGFTDMRYGINGLSAIIEQKYKMNVLTSAICPLSNSNGLCRDLPLIR